MVINKLIVMDKKNKSIDSVGHNSITAQDYRSWS